MSRVKNERNAISNPPSQVKCNALKSAFEKLIDELVNLDKALSKVTDAAAAAALAREMTAVRESIDIILVELENEPCSGLDTDREKLKAALKQPK